MASGSRRVASRSGCNASESPAFDSRSGYKTLRVACGAGGVRISLTLPLRAEPYESRGLHPFFENLLPEGWLLELSTAKLKIPKDDAFGLLLEMCADCIGAVEIHGGEDAS